jgi:hypothetical protein
MTTMSRKSACAVRAVTLLHKVAGETISMHVHLTDGSRDIEDLIVEASRILASRSERAKEPS